MDNREDVRKIAADNIEIAVRKAGQQGAPNTRQNFCVQQWRLLQTSKLKLKRRFKLRAKTFALGLVPLISFTDLPNGPARKTLGGTPRAILQMCLHLIPSIPRLRVTLELN